MHYRLAHLSLGHDIFLENDVLRVDSRSFSNAECLLNDRDFLGKDDKCCLNWVSGGGTYLINSRYLVLVRRSALSKVNAGKYSLFTGRSDNYEEWVNPSKTVRELFEELVLFEDDSIVIPESSEYQDIIDHCYESHIEEYSKSTTVVSRKSIKALSLSNAHVEVFNGLKTVRFPLTWHINRRQDVNILFLFSLEMDVDKISALDAEAHTEDGKTVFHNRDIYLLDLCDESIRCITRGKHSGESTSLEKIEITEHLSHFLGRVKIMNLRMC